MSALPRVSALVVTHNSAAYIVHCLRSLRAESRRIPLEVIVVDNASGDDTCAVVRRELPQARLVAQESNPGFAAANNVAAELARGEDLLLLNPDAELRPRAVVELLKARRSEPTATIIAPRIVRPDGRPELSWGPEVGFLGELYQKCLGAAAGREPGATLVTWQSHRSRSPAWVSGACMLLARSHWRELGGMDEAMFLYLEDVDLCARARQRDGGILFWPRAEIVHRGGSAARAVPLRAAIARRQSQLHYYRKHLGPGPAAVLRTALSARYRLGRSLARVSGDASRAERLSDLLVAVTSSRASPGSSGT